MRKRSTQEILEVTTAGGTPITSGDDDDRNKRIKDAQNQVANLKKERESKKPSKTDQTISYGQAKTQTEIERGKLLAAKRKTEDQKREDSARRKSDETASKRINIATSRAKKIAGDGPKLERISSKDKSVTATGKAAMNLAKSATSLGRKVASIPDRLQARKEKSKLGQAQMDRDQAPTSGTKTQRIKYATKNARKSIAGGIRGAANKLSTEGFIHEAENDKKEIKKEKIDVMKGTNKIEVNPKVQAEAKKMTKSQIEKRDEIADAISTREMNKRYGDKNVKYAIATKLAMKKKKKKKIDEALLLERSPAAIRGIYRDKPDSPEKRMWMKRAAQMEYNMENNRRKIEADIKKKKKKKIEKTKENHLNQFQKQR